VNYGDEKHWQVGDIVTRDGSDEQRIDAISECRDLIIVTCIKAPDTPWCAIGETEENATRRYNFVRKGVASQ